MFRAFFQVYYLKLRVKLFENQFFFSNKLNQLPPIEYIPSYRKQLASHKMGKNQLGFEKTYNLLGGFSNWTGKKIIL